MTAKSDRRKISRHEQRIAQQLGGRKTFASGSGDEKGDGRVKQKFTRTGGGLTSTVPFPLRIESKLTSKTSYTLSFRDWEKLHSAAIKFGEHPIFHVQITVPGVGGVEIAVLTEAFADVLGISDGIRLWDRDDYARSYNISWSRWSDGPFCLHLAGPHHLVVVDYLDVLNRIKERQ
jgi:hypothetical protein